MASSSLRVVRACRADGEADDVHDARARARGCRLAARRGLGRPGASDCGGAFERGGVEILERESTPGRPARFTTRELLEVEREALELALAGRGGARRPDPSILYRALLDSEPTLEQRALVRQASLQPDRVVCVAGVAGSGKTTALRVLKEAHERAGVPVIGAAPSGRAADELAAATGIRSKHLAQAATRRPRGGRPPAGCLLLVDEAGMAETRVLTPLLRMVDEAGGKAILIGDPGQLPAVGAGGLYAALCDRLGAISLSENRRQHDLTERQALARLRAGEPGPYLAHAARPGCLQLADDPIAIKQRLLAEWWQAAEHDLADTVMLAYRRDDVRDLNQAAQALMLRAGRRQQHERTRARAEQRLVEAEATLKKLGWRCRGKRRDELRAEIALQRAALRLADERLREHAQVPITPPARLAREEPARSRTQTRELARHREPPGLDLGR